MSDWKIELSNNMKEARARAFFDSKQRKLPLTGEEFIEWLLQFEEYNLHAIESLHNSYIEYVNLNSNPPFFKSAGASRAAQETKRT